jgi:hypothetical protein
MEKERDENPFTVHTAAQTDDESDEEEEEASSH